MPKNCVGIQREWFTGTQRPNQKRHTFWSLNRGMFLFTGISYKERKFFYISQKNFVFTSVREFKKKKILAHSFMNWCWKNYINANLMNTQIFHLIRYDLKGHWRSKKVNFMFILILTYVLLDNFLSLFIYLVMTPPKKVIWKLQKTLKMEIIGWNFIQNSVVWGWGTTNDHILFRIKFYL
jgi:hypothetical protein